MMFEGKGNENEDYMEKERQVDKEKENKIYKRNHLKWCLNQNGFTFNKTMCNITHSIFEKKR